MCDVLDRAEQRGGDLREAKVRESVATEMLKEKMPLEMIKRISKLSEESIRKIAKNIGVAVL